MPGFNGGRQEPSSTLGGSDVHRSHRWRISQLVGITPDVLVYSKELTLPEMGFEEEAIPGASVDYKFAKKATFSDVVVTFYDMHGLYMKLDELYTSTWNQEDGLSAANVYMAQTFLELTDGNGDAIAEYSLTNSWIKSLAHSPMSYESADLKTVTVTIAYSWANYSTTV